MNPNRNYWRAFYQSSNVDKAPSAFARYVADFIRTNTKTTEARLMDVGCGNGRDSIFFHQIGLDVSAIDPGPDIIDPPFKFKQAGFSEINLEGFNHIYLRFVVHSLREDELDCLLGVLGSIKSKPFVYIETRSTTGISPLPKAETFFRSPIGDAHYRILYSKDYLNSKLEGCMSIIESVESDQFAMYKEEKPFCIRVIGKVL